MNMVAHMTEGSEKKVEGTQAVKKESIGGVVNQVGGNVGAEKKKTKREDEGPSNIAESQPTQVTLSSIFS